MELFERTVESEVLYDGIIVKVRMDKAELTNGKLVRREVVEHPGGVAILPMTEAGEVYCVRQWRYPFGAVLLEVPAGKLERGEDPLEAALRELKEEIGAVPGKMEYLGKIFPSPGYDGEILHLYAARDLHMGVAQPDEDEFLEIERHSLSALIDAIMNGEISDAKTVAAVFMMQEKLRREEAE